VVARFDCFLGTSKERIARKYGVPKPALPRKLGQIT